MGDELGEDINEKVQSKDKQASDAYEETKRNSVNNSGKNNTPSLGTNPNSLFAGSGKSVNQSQKSQNTKNNQTNWLTANPDDLLGDSDDASLQDSDFKFSSPASNTSNSKSSRASEIEFWKSSEGKEAENPYIEGSHIGLGAGAMGAGIGEFSYVRNGMWLGNNGKMYNMSWTGNRWTGGRNLAVGNAEFFHAAGKVLFLSDLMVSGIEGYQDYKAGNYSGMGKVALDVGIGAAGVIGIPEAFVGSTAYFVVDKFVGWDRMLTFTQQLYNVDEVELDSQLNNMGFSR